MSWHERLTSVAIFLVTLSLSSSSTGSDSPECNIHSPFTSPNIEVFYEEEIPISGCQSSHTVATSTEVHVINLLSPPASAAKLQPGQRVNVSLNVQPQVRTVSQMRGTLLVFVLNSAVPVTWVLSTNWRKPLPIFTYRIVIPQNTSVIISDDLTVDLSRDTNLPHDTADLLDWVMVSYRAVTTFTAVEGANTINLRIGEDSTSSSIPSTCDLQDDFDATSVKAYYVQDKPYGGCELDQTVKASDIRQVHVIELRSASHEPIGAVPPQVVVDLKPIVRGREHLYNVVLVLKAHMAVTWNVQSETVSGKLEILSPDSVQAGDVGFHSKSQRADTTGMPDRGADLVAVVGEYGTVTSYTEAELANHFKLTVKESTNTDGLPSGPKTISGQQALGGPVLARITSVECLRESIRVTIPKDIIDYFGQASDMSIMMLDPSCKAHTDGSDLVIEMELDECGTTKIVEEDRNIFENEVIFSDSDYINRDGEGSGDAMPNGDIGAPPIDTDNSPIERFPIRCEYLPSGEPVTGPPPPADQEVDNDIGQGNNHVTLYMELFKTTAFLRKAQNFPQLAPIGDRLFFEVGLEGSDQLAIVPNHCWIAPGGSTMPVIIHELIVNSCAVDQTLIYHKTENYIKFGQRSMKRFSFQVPTLESDMLDFYVHCELGVCSEDGSGTERGIPMCNVLQTSSCLADSTLLIQGPLQRLNIGPLQINRGQQRPQVDDEGSPEEVRGNQIIIQGLSAGPAAAVAFAAFAMGVVLTACLWYIHAHTGPRTEPPASPTTVSTPSSPAGNGHILNGHIPNGFLMNGGAVGNGYPNGGINPNRIPPHGMMHGDPSVEEMV